MQIIFWNVQLFYKLAKLSQPRLPAKHFLSVFAIQNKISIKLKISFFTFSTIVKCFFKETIWYFILWWYPFPSFTLSFFYLIPSPLWDLHFYDLFMIFHLSFGGKFFISQYMNNSVHFLSMFMEFYQFSIPFSFNPEF